MLTVFQETHRSETAHCMEFETLFLHSHKKAYNLAYRMLNNACEAEDVTQDAFVRAWHSFEQYDRTRPFESWLFRIVTNLVIDRRRRQKRVPIFSLDTPVLPEGEGDVLSLEFAGTAPDPAQLVLSGEFNEDLERALRELPESYRAALFLADVEERSYQEIADVMGCAIGTVRSRIHRARHLVRKALERSAPRTRKIVPRMQPTGCKAV